MLLIRWLETLRGRWAGISEFKKPHVFDEQAFHGAYWSADCRLYSCITVGPDYVPPDLNALIDRAIAGNLDLRQAAARIREARAQRGISEAERFPTI
jgi:outer membrane protein TolC